MADSDAAVATGRFVRANGLDIYYEEYGDGPPLVFVHGGTGTIDHEPAFSAHFRVIAPNTRGHGRTANPTGRFSFAALADDVAALIDVLGLDRPLVAGYSNGGKTALHLGIAHPSSVRALVLGGTWHRLTPTYFDGMRRIFGLVGVDTHELNQVAQTHPDFVTYWQAIHAELGGPDYWKTLLRQMWPMSTTPLDYTEADFNRITVPTLVLIGDRDEAIPVEDAVDLYRSIPGAELGVIPSAGHLLEGRGHLYLDLAIDFLIRAQNAA